MNLLGIISYQLCFAENLYLGEDLEKKLQTNFPDKFAMKLFIVMQNTS